MKWFKTLFKKLSPKSTSKTELRDKLVEMYGEEAGEAYVKINMGIPIGGFLETAIFVLMVEYARKALDAEL